MLGRRKPWREAICLVTRPGKKGEGSARDLFLLGRLEVFPPEIQHLPLSHLMMSQKHTGGRKREGNDLS